MWRGSSNWEHSDYQSFFIINSTNQRNEEYRILVNMGNEIQKFVGLTNKVYEYVLVTAYSTHTPG